MMPPLHANVSAPVNATLRTDDGTPLFVVDWPVAHEGGSIMLMHGLGEHCGRYARLAQFLNSLGLSVRAYDHRGHGRSGGARGDVPDNEAILRDARIVWDDFAKQPQRGRGPRLLLGHSMGGLYAARFAETAAIAGTTGDTLQEPSGLILSSPALALRLSGVQKIFLNLLARFAPGLGIGNGLKTGYLSHDASVVEAYRKDPLVHGKISARLLGSMLATIDAAQGDAGILRCPVLMVVAGDDRLVDAGGSEVFRQALAPAIATFRRYDRLYHEVFNEAETNAEPVFADLRSWLEQLLRVAACGGAGDNDGQTASISV